jgi:hypothetical protein
MLGIGPPIPGSGAWAIRGQGIMGKEGGAHRARARRSRLPPWRT